MHADTHQPTPTIPTALGRVLSLLRKLIDYGRQLADTVHQHATATPGFHRLARPFGTADVAAILARITAGLRRAAALEATLLQRAAKGRDLTPSPVRMPAAGALRSPRKVAPPQPQPASPAGHPALAHLPTEAEIAAELRRRPIGAIIVDICRDLGIAPGHLDRPFWDELSHAIIAYGGSLVRFFDNVTSGLSAFRVESHADTADPLRPAPPPGWPAPATGPP